MLLQNKNIWSKLAVPRINEICRYEQMTLKLEVLNRYIYIHIVTYSPTMGIDMQYIGTVHPNDLNLNLGNFDLSKIPQTKIVSPDVRASGGSKSYSLERFPPVLCVLIRFSDWWFLITVMALYRNQWFLGLLLWGYHSINWVISLIYIYITGISGHNCNWLGNDL